MHDIKSKLALLDELKGILAQKCGEDMKSTPMYGDEEEEEEMEGEPEHGGPAALVVEVGAPKDGPPKPPMPGCGEGDMDIDSMVAEALASGDPKLKKMAEALKKAKAGV